MAPTQASSDRLRAAAASESTHAVVIGGSIGGLLTARVLAGHLDRVTLVERDALPDEAENRKGVPQGRQLHVLLARGLQVMDRLFPGYRAELAALGAVPVRLPADIRMLTPFGWLDRRAPGWEALSASRPLFETILRRRLRALPNVDVLDRHEATGLRALRRAGVVDAVRVRHVDDGHERWLEADLVADAAGRGSRAPHWLGDLGFPAPEKTEVDPDIAYATRIYRVPDAFGAGWKAVMLGSQPPTMPRTGYLFPIEDGRFMVALMGAGGQHPPIEEDGSPTSPAASDPRSPTPSGRPTGDPDPGHRGTTRRQWHSSGFALAGRFIVVGDTVSPSTPSTQASPSPPAGPSGRRLPQEACHRHREATWTASPPGSRGSSAAATPSHRRFSTGEDLRFPTTTGAEVSAATRGSAFTSTASSPPQQRTPSG